MGDVYLYGDTDFPENTLSAGEDPMAGKTHQRK